MASTSAPAIYGGDEVSALVIDTGSSWTRVGFAGEDAPKAVIPTYYGMRTTDVRNESTTEDKIEDKDKDGDLEMKDASPENSLEQKNTKKSRFIGDESLHLPRSDCEIISPMEDGCVSDWDAITEIWDYALTHQLRVDPTEHPLLLTEQVWNSQENRKRAMEIVFEEINVPAFYLAKSAVCSSFASGKANSLIVDVGSAVASVTPVIDGLVLNKPACHTKYAGDYLNGKIFDMLVEQNVSINPRYLIQSKTQVEPGQPSIFKRKSVLESMKITESYHKFQSKLVLEEWKETMSQALPFAYTGAEQEEPVYEDRLFEFPDGYASVMSEVRFKTTEFLFDPEIIEEATDFRPASSTTDFIRTNEKREITMEDDEVKSDTERETTADKPLPDNTIAKTSTDANVIPSITATEAATAQPSIEGAINNEFSAPGRRPHNLGLSSLIIDTINSCDVDVRSHLANNIVLTGGTTLIPGLADRVNNDVQAALAGLKVRIYAPGNTIERKHSAWIGGSILASLGTFHQLWVSKKEYEEVGIDKLLEKRFR
ncbi:Actin/actin-like protein [Nadsonia fulvescens var. elongata DSM 6958]|uniref:Actin n=1 Tax=Nadsonia fulvescens var. elongata DSM 6958 TaxID=857566 RepID=A0A1E3PF79_9ASCO|nr:Actin/actin-like protein [Nadsonia fulvescens var. elongata DSM 6958]